MVSRRQFISYTSMALAASGPMLSAKAAPKAGQIRFPDNFIWGAASAGHQVEGNNLNADIWLLENVKPSIFHEPSGDAANSLELWEVDLDLAKNLGLNAYRFSIEWARVEPEPGRFSQAMLDHYKRIIEGCHQRGLLPLVTFNHFTSPIWFSAQGGWTNQEAPALFARYSAKVAEQMADAIGYAVTFNEPNILRLLRALNLPQGMWQGQRAMLAAAAKASNSDRFCCINAANFEDLDAMTAQLIEGHKLGTQAIKAANSKLPVGFSLAMFDDQATGDNSLRDAKRQELYGDWLKAAATSDFIGVQNYERAVWDDKGKLPAPQGVPLNYMGSEVYAPSLANVVRYTHEVTGKPILITEHGVGTDDDSIRAAFIPASLKELKKVMDAGVPVAGYVHWALLDNFEWIGGYTPRFGLHTVDLHTFKREPKPSALVYRDIAMSNSV